MNKIINGRRFDTERAKPIAEWQNMADRSSFDYLTETLYRKKNGEYFLHGEGHGNTRYGEWHGNTGGWGEKIMPMSPGDARMWAESHLTADGYEEVFGDVEEGKATLFVNGINNSTKQKLDLIREETGKSLVAIIEEMIERY